MKAAISGAALAALAALVMMWWLTGELLGGRFTLTGVAVLAIVGAFYPRE